MTDTQEKIISAYKQKTDELLKKMYQIIVRAQRKHDNAEYKHILGDLEQ